MSFCRRHCAPKKNSVFAKGGGKDNGGDALVANISLLGWLIDCVIEADIEDLFDGAEEPPWWISDVAELWICRDLDRMSRFDCQPRIILRSDAPEMQPS